MEAVGSRRCWRHNTYGREARQVKIASDLTSSHGAWLGFTNESPLGCRTCSPPNQVPTTIEHMFEDPRRAMTAPYVSLAVPRPSLHGRRRATTQLALLDLSELLLDTVTAGDTNHGEVFTRR